MLEQSPISFSKIHKELSKTNGNMSITIGLVTISWVEKSELPISSWIDQTVTLQKYQSIRNKARSLSIAASARLVATGVVFSLYRLMQLEVLVNLLSRCFNQNTRCGSDEYRISSEFVEMQQLAGKSIDLSTVEPSRTIRMK